MKKNSLEPLIFIKKPTAKHFEKPVQSLKRPSKRPFKELFEWLQHLGVHALGDHHAAHALQQPHLRHIGRYDADLGDLELPLEEGVLD